MSKIIFRLIEKLEGEENYRLLTEREDINEIIPYLEWNGILEEFDWKNEYVESVINGNEDNLREYLRDTIENWYVDCVKDTEEEIDSILEGNVSLYVCEEDNSIITAENYDTEKFIKNINNILAYKGIKLIQEIRD